REAAEARISQPENGRRPPVYSPRQPPPSRWGAAVPRRVRPTRRPSGAAQTIVPSSRPSAGAVPTGLPAGWQSESARKNPRRSIPPGHEPLTGAAARNIPGDSARSIPAAGPNSEDPEGSKDDAQNTQRQSDYRRG